MRLLPKYTILFIFLVNVSAFSANLSINFDNKSVNFTNKSVYFDDKSVNFTDSSVDFTHLSVDFTDLFIDFDDKSVDSTNYFTDSNTYKYVSLKDFVYADTRRYLLAAPLPLAETALKPIPAAIFGTTLAGVFYLQHKLQMETIWKEHSSEFKVIEDGPQELWIDKVGHFYGAYTASYFLREGFLASGVSWNAANNIAAGLGIAYSTYVEILDGYGSNWGFSPSDFYADVLGGAFFIAQNYVPFLQNFSPKFLYVPSEWTGYQSRIPHDMFIDDYSSQFFFISINVENMLPDKWKKYYPDWLELSIGYTVRNLLATNAPEAAGKTPCSECISIEDGYWGSPRLVIALDYNLVKLLPDGGNTWNWFKQSLNLIKLPSPALEIGKVTRFYILFPFKIG